MNKKIALILFSMVSLQLFPSGSFLKKMAGLFIIADENQQNLHIQKRDHARNKHNFHDDKRENTRLNDKQRTQERQDSRDAKAFEQGGLSDVHWLSVAFLQTVNKAVNETV